MKKYLLIIIIFLLHSYICTSQNRTVTDSNIERLKREYFTKRLHLTPIESRAFWPVYRQYSSECRLAWHQINSDTILFREKVAALQDDYRQNFIAILHSHERANDVYRAERDFRAILVKRTMQERKR